MKHRAFRWSLLLSLVGSRVAIAQDASTQTATPPATAIATDGGSVDVNTAASTATDGGPASATDVQERIGNCTADAVPSGHTVRVETRIGPQQPVLGDRVIITYRLHHTRSDSMQFDPDPAAYAQPAIELEYAREQPQRDHTAHSANDGTTYGEVAVAVQPFRSGEVVIAPQLARLNAGGEIVRVCTPVVRFRVRDPFGNTPNPSPRDLTPPESVSEDALRWRWVALGLDALFLVTVPALLIGAYLQRRPRPVAPPPPPRPPWETALASLDATAKSDMLARGNTKDYYDTISDVARRYIGGMQGFDALEMTSDELLLRLKRVGLPGVTLPEIEHLLGECDLVKFARYVPTHEQSEQILTQAYALVRRSMPLHAGGARTNLPAAVRTPGSAPSTRTGASKPTESKSVESKSVESTSSETTSAEAKPADTKSSDGGSEPGPGGER